MKALKTEIIIETMNGIEFRWHDSSVTIWCEKCQNHSEMAMPGVAAIHAGISPSEIFQMIRRRDVHHTITHKGLVLVCLNSLSQTKENQSFTTGKQRQAKQNENFTHPTFRLAFSQSPSHENIQ